MRWTEETYRTGKKSVRSGRIVSGDYLVRFGHDDWTVYYKGQKIDGPFYHATKAQRVAEDHSKGKKL